MPKPFNKAVGERLKKIRQEHNLTQKEFGELFGMSANWVSSLEVGRLQPSLEALLEIHLKWGVPYEYIIEGKDMKKAAADAEAVAELKKERDVLLSIIRQITAERPSPGR